MQTITYYNVLGKEVNVEKVRLDGNGNPVYFIARDSAYLLGWKNSPFFEKIRLQKTGLGKVRDGFTFTSYAPLHDLVEMETAFAGGERLDGRELPNTHEVNKRTILGIQKLRSLHCGQITTTEEAVTIYRSLRRIESRLHRWAEDYCNIHISERVEKRRERQEREDLRKFQGYFPGLKVLINGDPRGYALKIDDSEKDKCHGLLQYDWGGNYLPSYRYGE